LNPGQKTQLNFFSNQIKVRVCWGGNLIETDKELLLIPDAKLNYKAVPHFEVPNKVRLPTEKFMCLLKKVMG